MNRNEAAPHERSDSVDEDSILRACVGAGGSAWDEKIWSRWDSNPEPTDYEFGVGLSKESAGYESQR